MRGFLLIVVAGISCAVLGAGFGWLVSVLSSEFVELLVKPFPVEHPQRLGAALGLVFGLLFGVCAMSLGLVIEAFRVWALRPRVEATQAADVNPDHGRFGVRSR